MQRPPPVSRRGPWCSVRSSRLALRPPFPRLLPGAANKAEKAKKGEENGPGGYGSGVGLELVERHVDVAAIARHDDGDGAAVLAVEQAHGAWRLPARLAAGATSGRSVAGIGAASNAAADGRAAGPVAAGGRAGWQRAAGAGRGRAGARGRASRAPIPHRVPQSAPAARTNISPTISGPDARPATPRIWLVHPQRSCERAGSERRLARPSLGGRRRGRSRTAREPSSPWARPPRPSTGQDPRRLIAGLIKRRVSRTTDRDFARFPGLRFRDPPA